MKKMSDRERMKMLDQISKDIEETDKLIYEALEEEDRLTYADEDDESEEDFSFLEEDYEPYIPPTPQKTGPTKREKRVSLFIFMLICAFACFMFAFIYDHVYNDFRILPVVLGGIFLILGVIVF